MKSKARRAYRKRSKKQTWLSVLLMLVLMLVGYGMDRLGLIDLTQDNTEPASTYVSSNGDSISVHYIDVGQGDCEFIQTPEGNMLIDSGEYQYVSTVIEYLEALGVEYIDIIVATHPHSDHMGGMAEIIRHFDAGQIIMPRASNNTVSYEKMLEAMKERGLKAHVPTVGEVFNLGGAEFVVIAPNSEEYENLNNYSVSFRMVYGNHSFIFTGDAEALSEKEMLANGLELRSDFLKVGHHGSRTSSTEEFIATVQPKVALISLGADNSYGHPHQTVVDRLNAHGVEIYRTDRSGSIVVETDGERYKITTEE